MTYGIFKNCLDKVSSINNYPLRFSDKQYSYLKELGKNYEIRSLCSPSIPIKFIKKGSNNLVLNFEVLDFARDKVNLDIYLNGIFFNHIDYEDRISKFDIKFDDKFNDAEIEIYLSNTCVWRLKNIDGEYEIVRENYNGEILILGDSISQGMETFMPSMSYANLLHRLDKYKIINQSCGGLCYDYKYLEYCEENNSNFVIVEFGTNDILFNDDIRSLEDNVYKFFNICTKKFVNSKIIVILPIPVLDNININKEFQVRNIIKKNLKKFKNINILDGDKIFPRNKNYYYDGTIHPNEIGNFLLYLSIKNMLEVNI